MPSCCAINCKNCSKDFRLFRLPTGDKNIERRDVWLRNIARKNWNPDVAYICENHFTPDQFEQNRADGRKLLKWNAIPTLFPSRVTKVKSRFLKKAKIPDNLNLVESEDSIPIIKQEMFSKDASTLILPQNITVPANNKETNKLSNEPIVYVKFEPNKEEDSYSGREYESDRILKEDILYLKRKIRTVNTKIKNLESVKSHFHDNLQLIFNTDQIQYLDNKCSEEVIWSNETLDKAKNLFKTCGVDGYNELIEQNLPYPPLDLLYRFHPELNMLENVM